MVTDLNLNTLLARVATYLDFEGNVPPGRMIRGGRDPPATSGAA
ncbi:hypothetical protein [Acrocarpospora macrocephala]|nr:hypothetical protein [Acrocarpospora macrocephala]